MSVNLKAVPASGYHFDSWSGDLSGNNNPIAKTIDCNKSITAKSSQIIHTMTMQVNGVGSTTPTEGNHSYGEGTTVIITATPDSGWQFDSWTGTVADPDSATTVLTIDSDKTIVANFSRVKSSWWLIGGIVIGVTVIAMIIWLGVKIRDA
jgi:hypothetical protein